MQNTQLIPQLQRAFESIPHLSWSLCSISSLTNEEAETYDEKYITENKHYFGEVLFLCFSCACFYFFSEIMRNQCGDQCEDYFFFLPPFIYFVSVTKPLQRTESNYSQPVSKTMVAIPWRPWSLAWQLYEQFEDLEATWKTVYVPDMACLFAY